MTIWQGPDTLHRTQWKAAAREKATVPLTPSYSLISLILDSGINASMREPQRLHLTELAPSNRWQFTKKSRQRLIEGEIGHGKLAQGPRHVNGTIVVPEIHHECRLWSSLFTTQTLPMRAVQCSSSPKTRKKSLLSLSQTINCPFLPRGSKNCKSLTCICLRHRFSICRHKSLRLMTMQKSKRRRTPSLDTFRTNFRTVQARLQFAAGEFG
ncbi:hypothetical protein BU25DRAFT_162217 [Macroventuria anomochaeta]|uniref:Uncharacterized protein n=1 Tax=Macroventuria anomochaeta TaxID=301207 RepID=A0ACB6RT82_9PLEO|nr:uncharacterized protein BU25DRAFT_162217 [Macroventuria anomochaeta]KAF2624144.1 hypothetical protein BU25DRAFT_162217 [Macroventuria anomochaeta]